MQIDNNQHCASMKGINKILIALALVIAIIVMCLDNCSGPTAHACFKNLWP